MDLSWSQTQWTDFFQRVGLVASVYHFLDRIRDELKRDEIIVEEYYDPNEHLTNWVLTGVDLFTNVETTLGAGLLYVSIAANADNWDVNIWKDSTRVALVAKATDIAAGATGVLAEQNDSGISGTVDLAVGIAADTNIWLRPKCGLLRQINTLPIDDTFDSFLQVDMMDVLTDVVNGIGTSISKVESFVKRQLIPWISNKMQSQEKTYQSPLESVSGGTVSFVNRGVLLDLIDAMNDETTAGAQIVETPNIGSISEAFDADNVGVGTVGTPTWLEYAENCLVTLECTVETIGSEEFSVVAKMDKDGSRITAQNSLMVKKTYISTDVGIESMTLVRTIVDAGGENDHFEDWAFSGETSVNTNGGVLYCTYTAATKLLEIFSDTARAAGDLVASGTWDGIDGSTCTLTEQNESGLSGSVKIVQAAAADPLTTNTLEVDLQVFKEEDRIYLDYSRTRLSKFELFFGRLFKTELPHIVSNGHTIWDAFANRGYSGLLTELNKIALV